MKNIIIVSLVLLIASMPENLLALSKKQWPKLYNVVVRASATIESENFIYNYAITNPAKNQYPIHRFELDLRLNPKEHSLSRKDLTINHTFNEHLQILEKAEKTPSTSFPPEGWETVYDGLWGVIDMGGVEQMIKPGGVLRGFKILSKEPVAIREFIVGADSWDFVENTERYDLSWCKNCDLITEVDKGIQFLGKTIAPVMPLEPFTISSWTARMTTDAVEARKLKWIKTDKNLAEIQKLINSLNTEDQGKLKAAVKKIESYVISEKKKGNLTDEADALVHINAEYLLKRVAENGKAEK